MKFMLAGNHYRTRYNRRTLLAGIAETRIIILAAIQQILALKIPAMQMGIAHRTAKAIAMPLLAECHNDRLIVVIVGEQGAEATGAGWQHGCCALLLL